MNEQIQTIKEKRDEILRAQNELQTIQQMLAEPREVLATEKFNLNQAFESIHKDQLEQEKTLDARIALLDQEIRDTVVQIYEQKSVEHLKEKQIAVGAGVSIKMVYNVDQDEKKALFQFVKENHPTFLTVDESKYLTLAKTADVKAVDAAEVEFEIDKDEYPFVIVGRKVSATIKQNFWTAEELELEGENGTTKTIEA